MEIKNVPVRGYRKTRIGTLDLLLNLLVYGDARYI